MGRRRRGSPSTPAQQRRPTAAELGITAADVAAELAKALRVPAGSTVTDITAQTRPQTGVDMWGGYTTSASTGGRALPLAPGGWTDPTVPFGPGRPVLPAPIDPLDPDRGRALPRRFEYAVSYNLPFNGDRFVPWDVLRQLSRGVGIIRKCIEIRKNQISQLDWDFVVDESVFNEAMLRNAVSRRDQARAKAAAAGDPDAQAAQIRSNSVSKHDVEAEFRLNNASDIARLKEWWKKPDRINDWTFEDWLTAAMEEYLVLDALTLYPHQTIGGDLHSLEVIDGSTIKPLLDHRGATPQPPNPAYQQVLHGFPRGEFVYTPGADGEYARDVLLYKPRNRRSFSPYGYGPTEQAIFDADLYMKRRAWMDSEYTDGVAPELLVKVDAPMTAGQLRDYETVFNDTLTGNTSEWHRAKFLPSGFEPVLLPSLEERYRADYDLHLIRLIALAYDIMPTELGFPPMGGLGGKGMADGEEDSQYRKTIRPDSRWLTSTINEVSTSYLGMPPGLTHRFLGLEAEDAKSEMDVMEALASKGGITVNEMRDRQGLPRYDIPEADMPLIITQRDVIPLSGALDRAQVPLQQAQFQQAQAEQQQRLQEQDRQQTPAAGQDAPPEPPPGSGDTPARDAPQKPAEPSGQEPRKEQGKAAGPDAVVAGLAVLAGDTGRLLLLQRALTPDDPAAGAWEFPGGHAEPGETPLDAARREWAEEVGLPVPEGRLVSTWTAGRYVGHVWVIPRETDVPINPDPDARAVLNPDDPDGDAIEVVAWWQPAHLDDGNPALRRELARSMPTVRGALATAADDVDAAKTAEAREFRAFVKHIRKGDRPFRPFEFLHHAGYIADAANDLAGAGEWAAAAAVLDVVIPV